MRSGARLRLDPTFNVSISNAACSSYPLPIAARFFFTSTWTYRLKRLPRRLACRLRRPSRGSIGRVTGFDRRSRWRNWDERLEARDQSSLRSAAAVAAGRPFANDQPNAAHGDGSSTEGGSALAIGCGRRDRPVGRLRRWRRDRDSQSESEKRDDPSADADRESLGDGNADPITNRHVKGTGRAIDNSCDPVP